MSSKKNVGRKRLGRIQIAGGGQNGVDCGSLGNRPFQLQSKQTADKKVEVQRSQNIKDDLSFSNSFVCDLDTDPDLMSALDKMERDFGSGNTGQGASAITKIRTSNTRVEQGKQIVEKVSDIGPGSMNQPVINVITPVAQKNGRKRKATRNSVIHLDTSTTMFDNFAWDSPMGVSTPVEPRSTRALRSAKKSVEKKLEKRTTADDDEKDNKNARSSINSKSQTIKDTPHRPTTKPKVKTNVEEPAKIANDSLKSVSKKEISKNTFFESLLLENDSMDISLDQNNKFNVSKGDEKKNSAKKTNDFRTNGHGSRENGTEQNASNRNKIKDDKIEEKRKDQHVDDTKHFVNNAKDQVLVSNHSNAAEKTIMIARTHGTRLEADENMSKEAVLDDSSSTTNTLLDKNDEMSKTMEKSELGGEINKSSVTVIQSDQLSLSSWGLPDTVLQQYTQRGITHMFEWQAECLLTGNVLNGGNLVYSAPTSAGKTMVAELLVLKKVMETRKKAIIILPFVSVTREKMFYLQELYQDAGIRVSGFMGHYAPAGGFSSVDVAVCTIEKGNGLINRLLEENSLDKLGIIVVDELHLLGDPHRGYLLELLLTKISYMAKKRVKTAGEWESTNPIQIVGMSATLPNLDLLATWLKADLYKTDYRPVPLLECMKVGTAVYNSNMEVIRDVDLTYKVKGDTEHVIPLCIETLRDGHSVLIFCPTKDWCEKMSETIARELYNLLKNPEIATNVPPSDPTKASDILVLPLNPTTLRDVVEQLRRTPVGLDQMLGRTVPFGVAYHHAGLTFDERDIVEGAFRQGILKVLVATSTLSSGVNLPARRVLIRTPVFYGGKVIDFLTYKQMIGRAGRKGVDTAGESILLCKPNEKSKAVELVTGELPPVKSTLIKNEGEELSSSMKRAILEVVVSGVAMETKDVASYAACTLLAASLPSDSEQTQKLIEQCIAFLQENEFVCKQNITNGDGIAIERFIPTQLGAAVLASSLSPDEGLAVFSELQRARQCFVLENELHVIYQVTPIYSGIGDFIDWYQFFCTWETLSPGMRRVAEIIGVKESFLAKSVRGRVPCKTAVQYQTLAIHKRFYTALVLHELVQEVPLSEVSRKFNCNKGQLQSLQQSAATFAGMVTVFCARLGWSNLELILSQFQSRLTFGVQRELCDLVRISTLNGQRARVLYKGGYQTVAALASAHPADVEALLKNSAPFQSSKKQGTETDWEAAERRKSRCIFLTGRKGVTEYEAAVIIIDEAKAMIQDELGGLGIQWNESNKTNKPETSSPVLRSPVTAQQRSFINQRTSLRKKKSPHSGQKRRSSKQSDNSQPPIKKTSSCPAESRLTEQRDCVVSPPAVTNKVQPVDVVTKDGDSGQMITGEGDLDELEKNKVTIKPVTKTEDVVVSLSEENACSEKIANIEGKCDIIPDESSKVSTSKNIDELDDLENENILKEKESYLKNSNTFKHKEIDHLPPVCESQGSTRTSDGKVDTKQQGVLTKSSSTVPPKQSKLSSIVDIKTHLTETELLPNNKNKPTYFPNTNKNDKVVPELQKDNHNESAASKEERKALVIKESETVVSPKHSTDIDDDFLDTFVLDTQTANSIISGLNKQSSICKKSNEVKSLDTKCDNPKHNVDNDLCSEALFSETLRDSSPDVNNDLIEADKVINEEDNLHESMEDDLHLKLSESCETSSQGHHTMSDCESQTSCDDLEMNVFQNSNEDMFNNSEDMIAASNYERVGLSGETSVNTDRMNSSYEDLHIPYQSGQEACFEKCDKEVVSTDFPTNVNICESNNSNKPGIQVIGSKMGLFSSPEEIKVPSKAPSDIGDSFSSTFNMSEVDMDVLDNQTGGKGREAKTLDNNNGTAAQRLTECDDIIDSVMKHSQKDKDQFGDSLTISMIDMVLETSRGRASVTCDNHINTDIPQGTSTKHNCDKTNSTKAIQSIGTKKKEQIVKTSDKAETLPVDQIITTKNTCISDGKCSLSPDNQFLTPKGRAVKRARQTPNDRSAKIAKTADSKHSTPEAQKKDKIRKCTSNTVNPKNKSNTETENSLQHHVIHGHSKPHTDDSIVHSTDKPSIKETEKKIGMTKGSKLETLSDKQISKSNGNSIKKVKVKSSNDAQVTMNEVVRDGSPSVHNVSTGSDCVPPTPPGEDQSGTTTTPIRTPLRSLNAMVYSPRLKSSSKKHQKTSKQDKQTVNEQVQDVVDHIDKEQIMDDELEALVEEEEGREDKLSPSFIDPEESGIPLTQASFTIIDVCGDKRLFKTFIMEWRTKSRYAVSIACEKRPQQQVIGAGIGAKYRKDSSPIRQSTVQDEGIILEGHDLMIVGVAVCWENRDAYYVSFTHQQPQGDPNDTLAAPPSDQDISIGIRIKAVKSVLQQAVYKVHTVSMVMFDVKAQYRVLAEGCGFVPKGQFEDPKIACWMLDPGARERTLHGMVTNLLPSEVHMLQGVGGGIGVGSLGLSPENPGSGRYRATTECVLVRHLGEYFQACLVKEGLNNVFSEVEMPAAISLCRMELNGFGFSQEESENQKTVMISKLSALEEQAYSLASHPFSLSSTEDISQILYVELRLPPNADPSAVRSLAPRGVGMGRGKSKPQYSTSKDVLEKLKKLHPLPGVILEWRRITNALTKVVFPLQKEKVKCSSLSMYRIYSECQLHSATGRVSLSEPNLQNVPKDFEIVMPDVIGESPTSTTTTAVSRRTRGGSKLQQMIGLKQMSKVTDENNGTKFSISMRHAFVPFKGGVLLAADYSQLELRMIAYLSKDDKLIGILNEDGDVFKLITAQWKNITPDEVTPEQRAQAKQVCYGMIYGIGPRALGEQLEVDENDAAAFIETFKAKYPGMRRYLRKTVELCRENGYVQTMVGRKRYLQSITSTNPHARAQAERQAVNTTVQGSAADLVKKAMIKIDEHLEQKYPLSQYTQKHKLSSKHPARQKCPPDGAYLVLQLHDELIYEVNRGHVEDVAKIVKNCMEHAMDLPVKMPVKLKIGESWGTLADIEM